MASDIKAPGRSAFWTEAALRALTGTAGYDLDDGTSPRAIALDAMALADAFEQACEERHAAECADDIKRVEAMREKVRQTKRYYAQDGDGVVRLTVASVVGATVTFEPHASTGWKESKADLADVLDPELYRPAGSREEAGQ
jgi:hypothetical protein